MTIASLAMTGVIGVIWALIGLSVARLMGSVWPPEAKLAVIALGFLAGLYRIEYAAWAFSHDPSNTFLGTSTALVTNFCTMLAGAAMLYYMREAHKGRRS